jgi:ribulose-phosphate 3-epimerase
VNVSDAAELRVAPSILAADFARLADEIASVAPAVPMIHVDVMDGHYVPNITIGPPVVRSLRAVTDRLLDCHLMVSDPGRYGLECIEHGADSVTFHPEVVDDPRALVDALHERGAQVGVALKPALPLSLVTELLPHVDLLLVMTVEPGFGGQAFLPEAVPKVAEALAWRQDHGGRFRIQVDGGITRETIAATVRAGADTFVAGSAIFGASDRAGAAAELGALAEHARQTTPGGARRTGADTGSSA